MITIKPDRSAFIPQGEELIGCENDHGVMTRVFIIKEILPEDCVFRIDVENTSDIIIPEKTALPDGRTVLTWTITSAVTQSAGVITVQLRAFDTDGTIIWHSAPIDFRCERSVHAVNEASTDPIISEFEQIEQRVEEAAEHCEDCADEAAATLQELIDEVGDVSDTIRALGLHLLDTDNPHEVTASAVGAYTKEEADALFDGKLPVSDGTAINSFNVAGSLNIVDIDAEKAITVDPVASEISFEKPGTVSGLAAPTDMADAATKGYVDSVADGKLDNTDGTMTGVLTVNDTDLEQTAVLGGASLTFDSPGHVYNLSLPITDDEAASKRYVDEESGSYHEGHDLTLLFDAEIRSSLFGGNAWAWIKNRITSGNFAGLHIGDFIPFVIGTKTYHAEIAGINTYKGFGDTETGNHIDFISRELFQSAHHYNAVAFNNGTKFGDAAAIECPWLASDLYLWLNSKSGTIASETAVGGGTGTSVDYTDGGIYALLPDALKAVIVEKRLYIEKRFSASSLKTSSSGNEWCDIGKLWLPTESEVNGVAICGTPPSGAFLTAIQYPYFTSMQNRVKHIGTSRANWTTISTANGNSTHVCLMSSYGLSSTGTAGTNTYLPICFRVAAGGNEVNA